MPRIVIGAFILFGAFPLPVFADERPVIRKLGTIDCDMVETTPVVFKHRLYRFEYVRSGYQEREPIEGSYFRFVDVATDEPTPPFAAGRHLGSAYVKGDTAYVFGVDTWGGTKMEVFWSKDLRSWESQLAFELPGWQIFNNSVCKDDTGYVMAFEIGGPPEETGVAFTSRFMRSNDLLHWALTPPECVHTKERYSACPALRYLDGYYYNIYLEDYHGYWAPCIVRSKDLVVWEDSPFNPIMKDSDDDKRIANPKLSEAQRTRIAGALNRNNSDVDFCGFKGKTIIYYSWGNQEGVEHLAEAVYEDTVEHFLKRFF